MAFYTLCFLAAAPFSKPNLPRPDPSPYSTIGGKPLSSGPWQRHFCIFCAEVTRKRSDFQPFLAHGLVVPEFGGCALEHDAAVAHHVDAMRYPHCDREFLLHQQDRDAPPGDFGDQVADLLHDEGS